MHCQKCGKKLKPGEMFCSICGYYNSEDDIIEESDNWNDLSTGNEIEIEDDDDDSDKWFEDDDTPSTIEDESSKKEGFWEKRKRERELKKAQQEVEKAEKAKLKEQDNKLKAERKEQLAKEELERKEKEQLAAAERKEQLEKARQEKEYQKALEKQQKEELMRKTENYDYSNYDDDDIEEKFLKAYIGEDYDKIRNNNFNLLAALLNWAYVLYRKLYITGIIGLLITAIVILKFPKLAILYAIVVVLLLGFGFNKYYLIISRMVIKNQRKKFEGSDDYSMEKILSRKGGVNVIFTLILYAIFLAILFYGMFHFTYNKEYNTKFWNENSSNAANCISLTKTSYNYLPNVEVQGQIVESTCKIIKTNDSREYAIYLKLIDGTKEVYAYFQTENSYLKYMGNTKNISDLEARQESLTAEEKQIYNELKSIQLTYNDIYEKSRDEEKLINEKKNTKERANFVFTKEEITR